MNGISPSFGFRLPASQTVRPAAKPAVQFGNREDSYHPSPKFTGGKAVAGWGLAILATVGGVTTYKLGPDKTLDLAEEHVPGVSWVASHVPGHDGAKGTTPGVIPSSPTDIPSTEASGAPSASPSDTVESPEPTAKSSPSPSVSTGKKTTAQQIALEKDVVDFVIACVGKGPRPSLEVVDTAFMKPLLQSAFATATVLDKKPNDAAGHTTTLKFIQANLGKLSGGDGHRSNKLSVNDLNALKAKLKGTTTLKDLAK